jgi:ectoine hydroxylase-related dioxygenase (phytanoyl-CoA dioxygenase family)
MRNLVGHANIAAVTITEGITTVPTAISQAERDQFDRDGYLIIKGALDADEVAYYEDAIDRVYAAQQTSGAMHILGAVANCPEAAGLVNHPATFRYVWSILGWNVHIYHSHLDVHPQITEKKPFRFEWHQDGGRQNRELETEPRPRLSVKLAYWLSDVSETGRGNFTVVPGSHLQNRIEGPPRRDIEWPAPEGAVEICASPGDVVFFDRRIWHTRSDNYSPITRKGMFFAYSHRWGYVRDEPLSDAQLADLSPVQRQLVGAPLAAPGQIAGDHQWGHYPETTPVYGYLKENGLLDPSYPPLIP